MTDTILTGGPIKRGRWRNADEILRAIERLKRRALRLRLTAEEFEDKAREKEALEAANDPRAAKFANPRAYRDATAMKRSRAEEIENKKHPKLQRKLAVMQTQLLPISGNDDAFIPK